MNNTIKHPLEPLTAQEIQLAVSMLKDLGKVTPTTRFISVSLKEPNKAFVHAFTGKEPFAREASAVIRLSSVEALQAVKSHFKRYNARPYRLSLTSAFIAQVLGLKRYKRYLGSQALQSVGTNVSYSYQV